MSQWKRIEKELNSFIAFGGLMDQDHRRQVAEWLFYFLYDPDYPAQAQLKRSGLTKRYPNWYHILYQLLQQEDLRQLARHNEDLAFSMTRETLDWMKKTHQRFEASHQHVEEEAELREMHQLGPEAGGQRWVNLLHKLKRLYPSYQRNWNFYAKAVQELDRAEQEAEMLRSNVLADWGAIIKQSKEEQETEFLALSFEGYFASLGRKVERLNDLGDLLSPFYGFLGLAWSDALSHWNQLDPDQLQRYAEELTRDRGLRELAELLGRWERARQHSTQERRQRLIPKQQWKPNPYGRSEIIGIHQSDELSRMLPSEVALLGSPETEVILSKKYVEKKLLTFQYRSQDLVGTPEVQEEIIERKQPEDLGPIILCVDTSGSMFGAPEKVAKALALAILEVALRQKRRAFLIAFTTGLKTIELTGVEQSLQRFVDFLKLGFRGGTDIEPALIETLSTLEQEAYQNADVLVISDFVIPRLSRKTFDRVDHARRQRGTRFHSLLITRRPDARSLPLPIFDQHWVYDLDNPAVMRQAVDRLKFMTGDA